MTLSPSVRPALRPGATLLRRDGGHLQIGTSPGYVISDQPGLFLVITMLDGIRTLAQVGRVVGEKVKEFHGDVTVIVRELMIAGLVFDARSWDFPNNPPLHEEARAASLNGTSTGLERRKHFRVGFDSDRASTPLARLTREILADAGIRVEPAARPDLRVMVSNGEPRRDRFETAMAADQDHLRVVIEEDRVRIGPLVRPGLTPCINCHDLHRTDWDRAWPALMTQFGTPATIASAPALVATTRHAASVAIAAEVIAFCAGRAGETCGQCVVIGPNFLDRRAWPVSFHPACSCCLLTAA